MSPDPIAAAPRFTMVVILVDDLARSVAFYRRLGVVFPDDVATRRDVVVDLGGGHHLVLWTSYAATVNDFAPAPGDGKVMLEFFVAGRDAVDAKYVELVSAGYRSRREPSGTDFGAYLALVYDPDGNTVLVTAG
jgi:catechol 2,3-dioxygenase-like lactoylglutathione lyase family enzyme